MNHKYRDWDVWPKDKLAWMYNVIKAKWSLRQDPSVRAQIRAVIKSIRKHLSGKPVKA